MLHQIGDICKLNLTNEQLVSIQFFDSLGVHNGDVVLIIDIVEDEYDHIRRCFKCLATNCKLLDLFDFELKSLD